MAKMFEFGWNRGEMIETEKAYGFRYFDECLNAMESGDRIVWLPKSQTTVMAAPDDGSVYWSEDAIEVAVPMWLARDRGYFKNDLLKSIRCY